MASSETQMSGRWDLPVGYNYQLVLTVAGDKDRECVERVQGDAMTPVLTHRRPEPLPHFRHQAYPVQQERGNVHT